MSFGFIFKPLVVSEFADAFARYWLAARHPLGKRIF